MGNQCCAHERDTEFEHIPGEAGLTFKSTTTPNPGTGELGTDASPANAEVNQNGVDDPYRVETDIVDEEIGGKYYGDIQEKETDGEMKNVKHGKGKYLWVDGREYNGEWHENK